eukprot:5482203-Pyramimonas_sp.AAC.1
MAVRRPRVAMSVASCLALARSSMSPTLAITARSAPSSSSTSAADLPLLSPGRAAATVCLSMVHSVSVAP